MVKPVSRIATTAKELPSCTDTDPDDNICVLGTVTYNNNIQYADHCAGNQLYQFKRGEFHHSIE